MYQNFTEGKFMFYDEKLSKTTEAYYLEPGLTLWKLWKVSNVSYKKETTTETLASHSKIAG